MGELLQLRIGNLALLSVGAVVGLYALAVSGRVLGRRVALRDVTSAAQRSVLTDLAYLVFSPVTETLTRTLTTVAFVICAVAAGNHVGPDVMRGFGPVVQQPHWLVVAEMLVLGDLIYYWTHRLAHRVPMLWRLHAVHHSTEHMGFTSAMRSHPAEAYVIVLNHVPLFALGFPIESLVAAAPIATLYAMLIHSNLDVSLRRVSYLFNSPLFHRWHHARDVEDDGVNFAGLFPIFDALFGTYYLPAEGPSAVGIREAMPQTFFGQLLHPFRARARRPLRPVVAPAAESPPYHEAIHCFR